MVSSIGVSREDRILMTGLFGYNGPPVSMAAAGCFYIQRTFVLFAVENAPHHHAYTHPSLWGLSEMFQDCEQVVSPERYQKYTADYKDQAVLLFPENEPSLVDAA